MNDDKFKTRSPMFCARMNDDVKSIVDEKAKTLGVANWVIVEKILENTLGIQTGVDIAKWLGINKNSARIGKPYKKVSTK